MDLDRYADQSRLQCEELVAELHEFGIGRLQSLCAGLGAEKFWAFVSGNEIEMLDHLRATPSERKRKQRKLDPQTRAMFVLGVLYYARCGLSLLQAVTRYGVAAGPGYRMISGQAAAACRDILRYSPTLWPFDDEDCPDPFDGA